jgi:recombination protein RecA
MYNEGISRVGDILDMGVELEVIEKRGSFYNYGELRLAQGRENAKEFLRENPATAEEIELRIREQYGLAPSRHDVSLPEDNHSDDLSLDE